MKFAANLLLLAAAFDLAGCNQNQIADPAQNMIEDQPNTISESASAIVRHYRQNKREADLDYVGHTIIVEGTVHGIDLRHAGLAVLELATGNSPEHLTATLTGEDAIDAKTLTVGRMVAISCRSINSDDQSVTLEDCFGLGTAEAKR